MSETTVCRFKVFTVSIAIALCAAARPQVSFTSTDSVMENAFNWARGMAMSYVHDGSDSVGLWYEAALPGRDAFCMRDLSHQVVGAEILGLKDYNVNMLRHIANGISESKDWCSFWEIDKRGLPATCDYANDKEFWYNLPANFDVVRACRDAFEWSGDSVYLYAPEFLNFYRLTAHNYADRWNLTPDSIMGRRRYMNTSENFNPRNGFHTCRGLPSYAENFSGITVAIDLLGAAMTGYEAYEFFSSNAGDAAEADFAAARAADYAGIIEGQWWDAANGRYNTYFTAQGEFHRGEGIPYMLLVGAIRDPERIRASVADVLARHWNVENLSAFPVFLYRNGFFEDAARIVAALPTIRRNDYPEVSFGVIEGIVSGVMGVEANASEGAVATCHRSASADAVSEVRNVPFAGGSISVSHHGRTETTFTNDTYEPVKWRPSFIGSGKIVDAGGRILFAAHTVDAAGNDVTTTELSVLPGTTAVVRLVADDK